MENDYSSFQRILEESKKFKIEFKNEEPNYFSVSGYPHYENVISNILSFFFDYNEKHQLGDLWLKSLLNCYSKKKEK